MKTTLHDFLKSAMEQGHTLKTLTALTRTFQKQLNPEIVITEIPEIEFNDLDSLPDASHADVFSSDEIRKYAESRNGIGSAIFPSKKFD
jgi:hypothetical protein